MGIRTRSVLLAAMTMVTAGAVTIAQSVEPAPPQRPSPIVRLVASVQPIVQHQKQPLLSALLDRPETAPTALAIPIAPNLANTIDNVYNAVEPWVQYGFELAAAAVAWVPYVGWLSGQIMVFYEFGESIVASGVYNFTDWLRGDGGIVTNLVDFGVDVGLAFVWLGLDEVAQFVPLPPFCCYPPRPPVQDVALVAETVEEPAEGDDTKVASFDAAAVKDGADETVTESDPDEQVDQVTADVEETDDVDETDEADDTETPVDITAEAEQDAAEQETTGDDTTTTTDVDANDQTSPDEQSEIDDGQTVDAPPPPVDDAPQSNPDEDSAAADE